MWGSPERTYGEGGRLHPDSSLGGCDLGARGVGTPWERMHHESGLPHGGSLGPLGRDQLAHHIVLAASVQPLGSPSMDHIRVLWEGLGTDKNASHQRPTKHLGPGVGAGAAGMRGWWACFCAVPGRPAIGHPQSARGNLEGKPAAGQRETGFSGAVPGAAVSSEGSAEGGSVFQLRPMAAGRLRSYEAWPEDSLSSCCTSLSPEQLTTRSGAGLLQSE